MKRWSKRRLAKWLVGLWLLLGVLAAIVFPTPRHVIVGIIRGEAFYRGRPTNHWAWVIESSRFPRGIALPFAQHLPKSVLDRINSWISFADVVEARQLVEQLLTGDPVAVPVLTELLQYPDQDVQCGAIIGLNAVGPMAAPAARALADCLGLGYQVEEDAVLALIRLGPAGRAALPTVKAWMNAPPDPKSSYYNARWPRVAGASIVWRIAPDDPDYLQPLLKAAREDNADDPRLQYQAIEILGRIGPAARDIVPKLQEIIRTQTGHFHAEWALGALQRIDPEAAASIR